MINKKVRIIDDKLSEYGGEFYVLWNIPKDVTCEEVKYNNVILQTVVGVSKYTNLYALGTNKNQSIASLYAGETQFKIIE